MAKQSTIITDGTTEIELVFDSSSQPNWRLQFGERVEGGSPRPQWHRPQSAPPELIELASNTGEARFRLNIRQDDDIDTVLNKIVELSRWIDGENQQAARYHTHGDVDRIELKVQRKSATNATVWPIIFGEIDDGGAHYTEMADFREWAEGVTIRLFLAPYGEAETAITLNNKLASSPHAIEDSNGDGLADGWSAAGVLPGVSIQTAVYLIGGKVQRMTVTSAAQQEGLELDTVTASQASDAVAYIWLRATNPNADTLTITLTDGSFNLIQSKKFDPSSTSGYDKSVVSPTGDTFFRYVLSGSNTSAADFKLRIYRGGADASNGGTYDLDGAYLTTGTTSPPDAWMSGWSIDNRYDPTDANPGRINYMDVWGVPGDAPALVDIELDWSNFGATAGQIHAGRAVDGRILAANLGGWVDSTEFSAASNSGGSWATASGGTENEHWEFTQDGGGLAGNGTIDVNITGEAARQLLIKPTRVFARVQSDDADGKFSILIQNTIPTYGDYLRTDLTAINTTGRWEYLDMGLLNVVEQIPHDSPDISELSIDISISVSVPASSSSVAEFDALLFLPTEEFLVMEAQGAFSTSFSTFIRGQHKDVIRENASVREPELLGTLWELEPGNKMNRLRFLVTGGTKQWEITDAANVTLTIIPRTRHLLGTT